MAENYTESLIFTKNLDEKGTPFIPKLVEVAVISDNGKVQCKQNVYKKNGINIISPDGLRRVNKPEQLLDTTNAYFIYEDRGEVLFSDDLIGQTVAFEYYGTGNPNIGDCRVFTTIDNNGNITETINDIIKEGRDVLESIRALGNGIIILNKLEEVIQNAETLNTALGIKITVGTEVSERLEADINSGNEVDTRLKDTIKTGNSTNTTLTNTIGTANATKTEVVNTINTTKTEAVNTINTTKTEAVNTINTTVTNANNSVNATISNANTANTTLNATINKANESNTTLNATITHGEQVLGELNTQVTKIEETDNKVVQINPTDWVLSVESNRYEYIWNHGMGKTSLIFEYQTLKNGKKCSYFMDYEIQDENNIKFITESADTVFVNISAKYYNGLGFEESQIEVDKMVDGAKKVVMTRAERELLNSHSSQLEQMARKDDVAKISSGTPLFASSTTGMTDTTKNYVNTSDGFLYIYSGGVWTKTSVQYQSTGIAKKSINKPLVEENLLTSILGEKVLSPQETPYVWGKVISSIDGTIGNNSNAGYFDIPLNGVEKINIPLISIDGRTDRGYAFYDVNGSFIKGGASNSYSTPTMVELDVPSNATNIKICFKVLESFNYITMYINSEYSLYNYKKFKNGNEIINSPIEANKYFEFENINLFDQFSKENLYNKGLGANLVEYDLVGSIVTHYIKVTENKNIYIEVPTHKSTGENNIIVGRYVTYDNDKKALARYDLPTDTNMITIPSGVSYIRLSFYYENYYKNIYSRIIVSETVLPYTKYGYQMPLLNVKKENITPNFYNWFNKKWVSLGDSNTSRRQYQKYVINELGLRWSNHAQGGTDASFWADDTKLQAIVDDNPDVMTIMLGTNTGAPDGELPPNIPITYEWDKTTYVGAMCYIIQYIQTRLPLCRIILMTPPYATNYNAPTEYYSGGIYNKINLLENIALRYGCEFLNVYSLASMYNFKSMFPDTGDGVHFGDEYGRRIARKIISKMKEIEPIE